jgi:hypothetical protein
MRLLTPAGWLLVQVAVHEAQGDDSVQQAFIEGGY